MLAEGGRLVKSKDAIALWTRCLLLPVSFLPAWVSRRDDARSRPRSPPALRLRNRGDDLGRDQRAVRGRDPRPPRADLPGRRAPLRAGLLRRPRAGHQLRVRGQAGRRGPLAAAGLRPAAERDPHGRRPRRTSTSASAPAGSPFPTRRPSPNPKDETESATRSTPSGSWRSRWSRGERDDWPDQLFLLGDQVYVDEGSPKTRRKIRERRGTETPPFDEVTDFEEYTWLYRESWEEPLIRWLFSDVSVSMLWDDHDMSDDWNISRDWLEEMQQKSWWHRRVVGCIGSYWIYQHIGNLSPRELAENELYQRVRGNQKGEEELFAWAAPDPVDGRRDPLELLPRLRPHQGDLHRRPRRRGCSRRTGGRSSTTKSGTGSSSTPKATSTTCCLHHGPLAPLPRLRPARGLERAALRRRLGPAGGLGEREAAARGRLRPLGRLRRVLRAAARPPRTRSPPASTARRRPRSSSSPATSTTPTSRGRLPARRPASTTAPRSTRRSARPTATRSTKKSGGWCETVSATR